MGRDASLTNSASIALGATSGAVVDGPDTFEFGTIDTRARNQLHQTGVQDGLMVVGSNTADMASIDTFAVVVKDCDTVGGTYVECARGHPSALGAKAGTRAVCPFPAKHRKFLKFCAVGISTGTLTTKNIDVWVEPGPNM